jgi:hypothetical protein
MLKRKIELPLETIDEIITLLGGFDALGKEAIERATRKGVELPAEIISQARKIHNTFKVFKKANDNVEVAELEELFSLSFEEKA